MRALIRRFWEWAVAKSGPPVAVVFVRGNDPQSVAMADEIGRLRPAMPRLAVSWGRLDEKRFREVKEFIALDSTQPWRSWIGLRRHLLRRRVALVVTQLASGEPWTQRWSGCWAGKERLVYNDEGECYGIDWRHPIATWRFLLGVPKSDIRRPTRLAFLGEWLGWARVVLMLADWRLRRPKRPKKVSTTFKAKPANSDGGSVLCVPDTDAAQLDRHVVECESAAVIATRELAFRDSTAIDALRRRLRQPGVWLVCARADFRYVLGEGWAPHRARESGTFCLGARSSLVAFRRDVFLGLGGLAVFEQQLPGQGWAALSLRALLRGHKAVYAGDIDARALKRPSLPVHSIAGPALASLLPVCDHLPTVARLLHRYARDPEFRAAFRSAASRLRLPSAPGRTRGKLIPLVEPGTVVLPGREPSRSIRFAVLAPELPSAAAGGGMSRAHQLLRRLAEHCDIYLFCFTKSSSESQLAPLLEFFAQLVLVHPEPVSAPAASGFRAAVGRHAALAMRRHLQVLLEDWRIPLLQVEGTPLAPVGSWLRKTPTLKVMAARELRFSLCHRARASALLGSTKLTRREAAQWRRYEVRHLRRYDCIVTSSMLDRELLARQTPGVPVRVVENGVDLDHFRNQTPGSGRDHLLWVAEFEQSPDIAAFQVLIEAIWPRIREARPEAKLTVVAGPDYRLHWRRHFRRRMPELPPEVAVLGPVGDLRPLYERAGVVIALSPAAGAASSRVLEALAMSRAVVATSEACRGLGAESGNHLLLAETPLEFVVAAIMLLRDEGFRRELGRRGRLFVETGFDWSRRTAQQLEVYEDLLRAHDSARSE